MPAFEGGKMFFVDELLYEMTQELLLAGIHIEALRIKRREIGSYFHEKDRDGLQV